MTGLKTYSELILLPTFEERFDYLQLSGGVGEMTFGGSRYLNQSFYRSREWKQIRDNIIVRDMGCDLACDDRPIYDQIYIHHINPITIEVMRSNSDLLLNPENLICVSYETHNALHYGSRETLSSPYVERRSGDTCPWKN